MHANDHPEDAMATTASDIYAFEAESITGRPA